jgi:hypothetical protein
MQVSLAESNVRRIIELLEASGKPVDKVLASYLSRKLQEQAVYTSSINLDEIPF